LLDRLGPIEMENRSLRVDRPEAFQGDERDVIFLGLVTSLEGDDGPRRIGVLSKRSDQQRINVAASRARDQVWVFHSVRPDQLSGGDVRRQYLEYLAQPGLDQDPDLGEVRPDVLHPAFDNIFEQRVYLAITARGYRVLPQYPAGRYRIDLVVMGGTDRLAIECDGDEFHDAGGEADDIVRQRELERLGWTFWRVRGSQFFRDPAAALEELWDLLDRLGIEPEPPTAEVSVHEEVTAPDPVRQAQPSDSP
ncbi:MAG TPA: AAA domain-containing protein, partial [Jiangellaceae bacterium]